MVEATKRPVFCFGGSSAEFPLAEFSNAGFDTTWFTGIIARQEDGAYFLACMSITSKKGLMAQGDLRNRTKFNQFIILN